MHYVFKIDLIGKGANMKSKPMRVLVTAPLGVGGISSLMINIQKNMDRDVLNFDYLTLHDRKEPQEDIVLEMGSNKYVASADNVKIKPLRFVIRLFQIKKICKENNVKVSDIAQIQETSFRDSVVAPQPIENIKNGTAGLA